jgi:hypothetical protein
MHHGNKSAYDYSNKRQYVWDLEAIDDPNGPKDVHEDPTLG